MLPFALGGVRCAASWATACDYSIYAGRTKRDELGKGTYRGFEPVDGGARRTLLMNDTDRAHGLNDDVLRDQLAASKLYLFDDPKRCAVWGKAPERVDRGVDRDSETLNN